MIKLSFVATEQNIARMKAYGPKIVQVLFTRMNFWITAMGAKVTEKLSGPVLKAQAGVLRGSVQVEPAHSEGKSIIATVGAAAPPAQYGIFHEYGTSRFYEITASKARFLKFAMNGKDTFRKSVIHPPIKERSFARSTENEMRDSIIADLRASVDKVVEE